MRLIHVFIAIFAVFSSAVFSSAVHASAPFETKADFALIMDYRTGEILYEKNARTPTAPASMSKLMTAAIVFEKLDKGELKLSDKFRVSEKAWRKGGSKMWVRVNTDITLENLLRGVIVQSGNDACIVIAENISGSEEAFAVLMNQKAREWGMNDSTFANATGWPDENQKMSMRDLGLLTRRIISQHTHYYGLFAETAFTWENIRQDNRNPLLDSFNGADGLKTGHTEESGYGLVGSAVLDGERRIVVVNGLESDRDRNTESTRLMNIAFADFEKQTIFNVGDAVGEAQVFKGKAPSTPLTLKEDVSLIVHRSLKDSAKAYVVYEGPVSAPVRAGQQIGYLRVEADGVEPREYPLYAQSDIGETGIFGKIILGAKKLLIKPDTATANADE